MVGTFHGNDLTRAAVLGWGMPVVCAESSLAADGAKLPALT
jgi:hypothetical protein